MKTYRLIAIGALGLLAAACATARGQPPIAAAPATASLPAPTLAGRPGTGNESLTRVDQQGAVSIEVTPLNLGAAADDLEFEVAMNTHSVDLSMDLAALATLRTDTVLTIPALVWNGPGGGHHVSGRLDFLAREEGRSILDGVRRLTLTIVNVDAPWRSFEWDLK